MKIVVATAKAPHNRRVDFAMNTWTGAEIVEIECERVGDSRGCYYFKDVFDFAFKLNSDDIFCYLNNDVALVPEWLEIIVPTVQSFGSVDGPRVEVAKFETPLTLNQIVNGTRHGGRDIFAFKPQWWREVHDNLPDLLLGYEGFDFVVTKTIDHTGGQDIAPICYHEKHIPVWQTKLLGHSVRDREKALLEKWMTEKMTQGWQFDYRPYGALIN
jgi:hypothetical protein